jgi:hypothetical protein
MLQAVFTEVLGMRYFRTLLVAALGAASLVGAGTLGVAAHERGTLVEFDSMTPVSGAAVGTVNDRGIKGGGLPWVIKSARGEVDRHGNVEVRVRGLVIPVAPFNGTNPVGTFGVIVSCLSHGKVANTAVAGLSTATAAGDATIETRVALPRPCQDSIVFVTSPTGAWFAMSNLREGDDD